MGPSLRTNPTIALGTLASLRTDWGRTVPADRYGVIWRSRIAVALLTIAINGFSAARPGGFDGCGS
jgi:hypothetical protein